jgi:hypothetical protein
MGSSGMIPYKSWTKMMEWKVERRGIAGVGGKNREYKALFLKYL